MQALLAHLACEKVLLTLTVLGYGAKIKLLTFCQRDPSGCSYKLKSYDALCVSFVYVGIDKAILVSSWLKSYTMSKVRRMQYMSDICMASDID